MKSLKQTYLINAPLSKVWQALVDPKIIDNWGGGPAKMEGKEGFNFKLWGGDIHGKNTKVVKEKELTQEWFGGDWGKPSKVTFKLSQNKDQTKLELIHTEIPESEAKDIEEGWKDYYLGPLKKLLET